MTLLLDPRAIHIFVDGSSRDNPGGRSGLAGLVRYPDHMHREEQVIFEIGYRESTNNRMELLACIKALEWIRENMHWPDVTRAQIVTDSRYVVDNAAYRADEWKKNKWRSHHGEPKENHDLWKRLLAARRSAGMRIDFVLTKGKRSDILRRVDRAAKEAGACGFESDAGYRPGVVSRSMVAGPAARFSACGQIALIRPYRKNRMRAGDEKIRFDLISDDGRGYVDSFFAYVTPDLAAELHRQHGYRVRFNSDPNYPQILEAFEEVPLPEPIRAGTCK